LEQQGIAYTVMPVPGWATTVRAAGLWTFPWRWWRYRQKTWPRLLAWAAAWQPDLIHSNSTVVAAGWQLAEALGVPHVWHIREFGWADYQLVYPFGKALLRKKLRHARKVVAISQAIARAYSTAGITPAILYNGIGTEKSIRANAVLGQEAAPTDTFTLLIIGLLQPGKRQHEAIRAFAPLARRYPQARLVIAGGGQRLYTAFLRGLVRWYGLRSVITFTGYVPRPERLYAACQVVLMCSHHEAMGRVTAEGMSYGKPVIGYRGGATPEIIQEDFNGWLYNDTEGLRQCMEYALQHPEECWHRGQHALDTALGCFSDEHYTDTFYGLLSECLAPKP
jgi:glycosyltransferase involved in cell wall biosynthesis